MKIDEVNQQAAATYMAKVRNEKHQEPADSHSEAGARQQPATDTVELSGYIPVAPTGSDEQETRASRVEELKAQIADGSYNVSARAVAEKMLSNIVI